jgi:ribosomal-protein-alanine N-acetyltransferase
MEFTPYGWYHRAAVLEYIQSRPSLHHHLDWQPIPQWLGDPQSPLCLGWQARRLEAILAFSPPLDGVTWIRLAGVPDPYQSPQAFHALWEAVLPQLKALSVQTVAVMPSQDWFVIPLAALGFRETDSVINYVRDNQQAIPAPHSQATLKRLRAWDVQKVLQLDHAAFAPIWQMRLAELRETLYHSAYAMGLFRGRHMVGYQLASQHENNVHLSRLAVSPALQGQGLGALLLTNLIEYSRSRGVAQMTVNTQRSNTASQRLYERFGFVRNFFDYPVYTLNLA